METAAHAVLWPRKDRSPRIVQQLCAWQVCEHRTADVGGSLLLSRSATRGPQTHSMDRGSMRNPGTRAVGLPNPTLAGARFQPRLAKAPVHLINFKCLGKSEKIC